MTGGNYRVEGGEIIADYAPSPAGDTERPVPMPPNGKNIADYFEMLSFAMQCSPQDEPALLFATPDEAARQNGKRPAYIRFLTRDDLVVNLIGGDTEKRGFFAMLWVPRELQQKVLAMMAPVEGESTAERTPSAPQGVEGNEGQRD